MPRNRKPAKNYFQVFGRPHVGLRNPEKFGLTYEEVVRLIDNGEWRAFYRRWLHNQDTLEQIKLKNYTCPLCKRVEKDPNLWTRRGRSCTHCLEKPKPKRVYNDKTRVLCDVCMHWQEDTTLVETIRICARCLREIENEFVGR